MATVAGIDAKEFYENIERLQEEMLNVKDRALRDVAFEIMRLSSFEVPHDKGLLQASGSIQNAGNLLNRVVVVGYNKVYAARLHEHPEYNFQKGRKGKYLEDPIKNNLKTLLNHFGGRISEVMKKR